MKKNQWAAIGLALFVVFAVLPVAGEDAPLTNEDILRLTRAGLGAELIISKIQASKTDFDTSVEQLVALKEADVPDSVLAAMMGQGVDGPASPASPASGEPPQATPAATAPALPAPGSSFRDRLSAGGEGPEMVVIPAGSFRMGCVSGLGCDNDEQPVHEVVIAKPFAMSKYEITFEDYDRFTYPNKVDDEGWGRGRRPVINVSWDDVTEYAAWLSAQTGKRYRLPSEAEWEYAARAGSSTKFAWGNTIGRNRANCDNDDCGDRWEDSAPVGSFSPNAFGLYDMHGNVSEWVQDCWNDSYAGAPADGRAWTSGDCDLRVRRGGFWYLKPGDVRSASRRGGVRTIRYSGYPGFRLVQDL